MFGVIGLAESGHHLTNDHLAALRARRALVHNRAAVGGGGRHGRGGLCGFFGFFPGPRCSWTRREYRTSYFGQLIAKTLLSRDSPGPDERIAPGPEERIAPGPEEITPGPEERIAPGPEEMTGFAGPEDTTAFPGPELTPEKFAPGPEDLIAPGPEDTACPGPLLIVTLIGSTTGVGVGWGLGVRSAAVFCAYDPVSKFQKLV